MLSRLNLIAPRSTLRSRALWPRPGSLFDELEREMDAMWELLAGNWRPTASSASTTTATTTTVCREARRTSQAASPDGSFAVTQDMAGFDPQELVVKLVGEKVVLTGKRATQTPEGPFRYELFRREWDVPETVDRERLSCFISRDGELHIEAPAAEPAARTVPIVVNRVGQAAAEEAPPAPVASDRAQG